MSGGDIAARPLGTAADIWAGLRRYTPARIAMGRAGSGVPTAEVLRFALAHAEARDAVAAELDLDQLIRELRDVGFTVLAVESAAPDRTTYLARSDLGRRLARASAARLVEASALAAADGPPPDLAVMIGDGLSAPAAAAHTALLLAALRPRLNGAGLKLAPVVVARQARVALGDEVGAALGARAVLVLIGERPGLTAPDSLGAYLTISPRPGRTDAERNCVSNIRPAGLTYDAAAMRLSWLVQAAFRRGLTGIGLKDESDLIGGPGSMPTLQRR